MERVDYLGKADSVSPYGATSIIGIKYSLSANDQTFSTTVNSYFVKQLSWVRIYSTNGLNHEQGHFDIAEIFARKLRKFFSEYRFNTHLIKQDFKSEYLSVKKQRSEMDRQYDKETDFSRNKNQQLIWQNKLRLQLDKLKDFQSAEKPL